MAVRVFVGTSQERDDYPAEKALEYSLHKHASQPVQVTFMRNTKNPNNFFGNCNDAGWATPFTVLRWLIPEYCNFQGRAIYMDVDQLNLRDISELFHIDMKGKPFACRHNRLCVIVFDNAKMKKLLPPATKIKAESNFTSRIYWDIVKRGFHFDPRWNCLDGEGRAIDDIYHLHFTRMASQPWKPAWAATPPRRKVFEPHKRPDLVQLWEQYRDEALAEVAA